MEPYLRGELRLKFFLRFIQKSTEILPAASSENSKKIQFGILPGSFSKISSEIPEDLKKFLSKFLQKFLQSFRNCFRHSLRNFFQDSSKNSFNDLSANFFQDFSRSAFCDSLKILYVIYPGFLQNLSLGLVQKLFFEIPCVARESRKFPRDSPRHFFQYILSNLF